jgi:Protein of unknown function (DUF3465)
MTPKKVIALAVLLIASLGWYYSRPAGLEAAIPQASADQAAKAFADQADGRLITVQGTVDRLLPDDRDGSPHQRFVVRTASGQTLMVAHNIDLAPRLDGLRTGDTVTLYGEYVWNNHGGLMHWTHRDPSGRHAAGYIEWQGRRYQ